MSEDAADRPAAESTPEYAALAERAGRKSGGPLSEFWYFLGRTRKWWMAPVILALLLVGFLLVTGGTALAPLIYTVF